MTNHPTTAPPPASARDRQRATVLKLAELLTKDLPELIWSTHPHRPGRLGASVPVAADDPHEALRLWAAFLDADIADISDPTHVEQTLAATGQYEDLTVTVRAYIHETAEASV